MATAQLVRRLLGLTRHPSSDPRLDAFFTVAPAGLAILDRDLRYVQLNETLAQMNGVPVEAHLGKRVREVLPALAPVVEPVLTRIVATGEPALNIEVSGETPDQPGVTRHWVASYFALPGESNEPEGIGAIVVEDTARRRAEQARRRSAEQYQAMIEHAAYGMYRSSLEGRFLKVNPALVQMLGYESEAELLALDLGRDVYGNAEQRQHLIERFRDTERIQGVEAEWKRKDGHRIVVRLSGRPVRSEPGDLLGFEMMAEDVTEQRALEHALRQAQKMETIGQLTSGIAHEFNNVLTVILTQAQLAVGTLPADRSDLRHDLTDLSDAARRGAELVQKLLGFSRSQKLDLQPLSLAEYMREVMGTLRRVLPETIEVEFEADEAGAVVEADSGALQQILLNLATNARDAMPDGGTLHIELRRTRLYAEDRPPHAWVEPGPYACIAVSDTGVGMDQQTLARVLEPFFTTLLVEDDPTLRTVAERLLKKVGYRVLTALDGADGLDVYQAHHSEIAPVITDMVMPKASGVDLYEAIRRQSRTTNVLFTSGYPAPNYRKSVSGDANVAFVTKPWTVSDLLARVRAMLDAPPGRGTGHDRKPPPESPSS